MALFPDEGRGALPERPAPDTSDRLTLALADRLGATALDAARELGFGAAVAVVDAGGHLVAFRRDDDALFVTTLIAQRKAWTAASSGLPTEQWNALAADPEVAPIVQGSGILAVAGGLPLIARGRVIGGLGVSGGTAAQDRDAALAALASFDPQHGAAGGADPALDAPVIGTG